MSGAAQYRSRTNTEDGRIIITGTGRAGTTLLVQFFTALGFNTGFTLEEAFGRVDGFSQAGLERHLVVDDNPYVIKSPEYSDHLLEALDNKSIDIFSAIVPMRALHDAAESRRRVHKAGVAWGSLWKTDDPDQQEDILATQFFKAVYALTKHGVPTYFLDFPRFAYDFHYFHGVMMPLFVLHGVSEQEAETAYFKAVDRTKIHTFSN
ncbi:hypothetical protein [Rhizobium lusitanum]|uniref:Sulfotransferase family protein n=1 Tax=Rhizobium lusitanum TaxID=293958 RepID=A0A1C3UT18_9HYPH|nr:hypothetical protein [Rhizobium lusitanum]SCB18611.1 hypothetical protein GA0061101_103285 [Rhizobium lusitanum]